MAISVLVTGGTGFVGALIVDALQEKHPDWTITVLDLNPPKESNPTVAYHRGDVTEITDIDNSIKKTKPAAIIHTAGLVPPLKNRFTRELESLVYTTNVTGTANALRAAQSNGVSAFIYTSSCTAVIDNFHHSYRNINETHPTFPSQSLIYGESKARAEALVLAANKNNIKQNASSNPSAAFSTCALRPSVLFGPGDYQLIPSIHAMIAKRETPFILGSGENLWDVSYAPNIADAHVLAVENLVLGPKTAAGEAIFIQNNEPITFRDFCLEVWKHFGHVPGFEVRVPFMLAWMAGWVAEWVTWVSGNVFTVSRGSVMDACAVRYASGDKARRILGFEPKVGIEEGIRSSCEEYARRLQAAKMQKTDLACKWSLRNAFGKGFSGYGFT